MTISNRGKLVLTVFAGALLFWAAAVSITIW